jgi:ABC-2 type transport system ATP-binding protein
MIETRDLRVDYGDLTAVQDLTLEIPRGQIFGLIGPNGAGKTSTMKVLATLLLPTYGEVRIGGVDVLEDPRAAHRLVGYLPDWAPVCSSLKVWEFLYLFAGAYGIPPNRRRIAVDEALQAADLTSKVGDLAGTLSRGMKQRLGLAKVLLNDPEVLILDEPASGLDPRARIDLRKVLKALVVRGRTVIISSHILTELQGLCTSLGIMEKGRLVVAGTLEDIAARVQAGRTVVVTVIGSDETRARAREVIESTVTVTHVEERPNGDLVAGFRGRDADLAALLTRLVRAEIPVMSFREESLGVEDVFLQVGAKEVA